MARYSKEVVCFECNPLLYTRLESILPKNASLHKIALSDCSGFAELRFDPSNTGIGTIEKNNLLVGNSGIKKVVTQNVPIKRLDDYSLTDVSFIKIDIEGHELQCLKGAETLLNSFHPALLIEIEERHCPGNLVAVPDFLRTFDYHPFILSKNGLYLQPVLELNRHAQRGVNNFWFLPLI
ncbi:FkbM family methyltransferase [Synechococcus sp. CBW1002]|uniref:FkbM family methyltransferase n=1 Tax=Synechococcus sp. CBW1002 TaxID=1353134 RepID=UPI0018CF3CD4|nr:FkbM family methyltransferase [Synechococcus sp. CBW1002]QPN59134.1 FkbM family methyltransferase [Synechococcus sp. CBW1002]